MNTRNLAVGALLVAALIPATSWAGTGGSEFAAVYTMVTGWISGTLGKLFAIGFFIVGIAVGVTRQSLMAVVTGVSCALVVGFAPTVIDGVITAELTPELIAAAEAAAPI